MLLPLPRSVLQPLHPRARSHQSFFGSTSLSLHSRKQNRYALYFPALVPILIPYIHRIASSHKLRSLQPLLIFYFAFAFALPIPQPIPHDMLFTPSAHPYLITYATHPVPLTIPPSAPPPPPSCLSKHAVACLCLCKPFRVANC